MAKKILIEPIHYIRGENIYKYLNEINNVNRLNYNEIESFQKRRLCELMRSVLIYNNFDHKFSKYYNRITIDNIYDIFSDLPVMTKEAVRNSIRQEGKPKHISVDYRSTSGSTGLPFQFYKDRHATGYMDAVLYSAYSWHGIMPGDPQARFWGVPLNPKSACVAKIKDMLKNRRRFSAFDLSESAKEEYYRSLQAFKPAYFYGYPSLMAEFCTYVLEKKMELKNIPLKAVIGTGEYVYQKERDLIHEATGAAFVNEYGCTEVGIIGFECEHHRMHLMAANIYLEILNDGKRVFEEEGDVHVTELNAYHRPFIRYALGDRGIIRRDRCSCGRELPVIEIVSGRKDDYLLTPDGRKVYDAIFAYTLKQGVDQFKAVQKACDKVVIDIKPNKEYTEELGKQYIRELTNYFGNYIDVSIRLVNSITREKSGKLKYFYNEITNN